MSNESVQPDAPLTPSQEVQNTAYLEEIRYAEENLTFKRKRSPVYTYVAFAVGAAMVGFLVYVLLHRSQA